MNLNYVLFPFKIDLKHFLRRFKIKLKHKKQ